MGLKEIIKSQNLSQKELSEKSGVPRQSINGLATGKRDAGDMSLRNAVKLGDVLNVRDLRDFLD